jgi:hypothetical protein
MILTPLIGKSWIRLRGDDDGGGRTVAEVATIEEAFECVREHEEGERARRCRWGA